MVVVAPAAPAVPEGDDSVEDDAASLDEGDMDDVLLAMGAVDGEGNLDTQAAVQVVMGNDNRTEEEEPEATDGPPSAAPRPIAGLRRSNRIAKDASRLNRFVEYDYA